MDCLCVVEALVLVDPNLLFFETAVEAFDVAVSLGVVVGGAAVLYAEPAESFDITRRSELRAVIGVEVEHDKGELPCRMLSSKGISQASEMRGVASTTSHCVSSSTASIWGSIPLPSRPSP